MKTLLIFLFLSTNAFAGMDFTHMGDNAMTVPIFKTTTEAREWAQRTYWIEPLRQELIQRRYDLRLKALSSIQKSQNGSYDQSPKPLLPAQAGKAETDLLDQWERYGIALEIMEGFREQHLKGAAFEASAVPLNQGFIYKK